MGFFHRFAPLSLCCVLLLGMAGPAYARVEEILYYEAPELVTDVYLPYQGGLADFEAAMGGWWDGMQYLYPNGDEYEEGMLFANTKDNQDGDGFTALLTEAAASGGTEFTYPVAYGIAEKYWEDAPEKLDLWNRGLLQARPASFDVTVHLRPDDLVATYRPDPSSPILTVWVDRDAPFEWLYLTDYDPLIQTDSPYDTADLDFKITWDEQSYIDGMASGEDRFYVTGTYTGLYGGGPEDWQYALYDMGLIRSEGEAKTLVRVNEPGRQLYYNPYFPRFHSYGNPYQFQIHIRPGTGFDEAVLPATAVLDRFDGDAQDARAFGLNWNRAEYEAGLASGADSFTVMGAYGPNPEWTAEDQTCWENGTIKVLDDAPPDTPAPELTVHILPGDLPFTVAMEYRSYGEGLEAYGGLIPTFSFPWPNGARSVAWAFSFDKETWYQDTLAWSSEWECGDVWCEGYYVDENDKLVAIPEDEPVPFYCKLTVTGSAFAGETAVMIVTPDEDGSWNMTEDPGGDHGGGGQGEHDRPGKEEPDDPPEPPTPDPEPEEPSGSDDASKPEPIWPEWSPAPEAVPTPSPAPAPTSEPAPAEPTPGPQEEQPVLADIPIQEEPSASSPAGSGKPSVSTDTAQTAQAAEASQEAAPSPSEMAAEEPAPTPASESPMPVPTPDPVPEPRPTPEAVPAVHATHVPGFVAATAVTAALVLCGAAWFHQRGKRK